MPVDQLWFDSSASTTWGWLRAVRAPRAATCCRDCWPTTDGWPGFEEGRLFGGEWLRAVGMLPNEYLYYYYYEHEALVFDAGPATCAASVLLSQQRYLSTKATSATPGCAGRPRTRPREASYMAEAWSVALASTWRR